MKIGEKLTPGERIDKYVIEAQIGRGGSGDVYRVRHEVMDTPHAIKVIVAEFEAGDSKAAQLRDRMHAEARILGKLRHENIVEVQNAGTDVLSAPGRLTRVVWWIVMEYLDGQNLREHLARVAQLRPRRAAETALQIARALEFAHRRNIVHRDMKPENVMLLREPAGRVKILDLGIAKYCQAANVRTTGLKQGTPPYMSPEQVQSILHPATDVYALSSMLWEMLVGRFCWAEGPGINGYLTGLPLLHKIANEKPAPVVQLVPSVPRSLSDLINWAQEKDPDRRPDMTSFARELEAIIPELPADDTIDDSPAIACAAGHAVRPATVRDVLLPAAGTPSPSIRDVVEQQSAALDTDPASPPSGMESNPVAPMLATQRLEPSKVPLPPALPPPDCGFEETVWRPELLEPTPSPMITRSSPVRTQADVEHEAPADIADASAARARDARWFDRLRQHPQYPIARRAMIWALPIGTAFGAPLLLFQLATRAKPISDGTAIQASSTAGVPSSEPPAHQNRVPVPAAVLEQSAPKAPPLAHSREVNVSPPVASTAARATPKPAATVVVAAPAAKAPKQPASKPSDQLPPMPGSGLDAPPQPKPRQPATNTPKAAPSELPFDPSKPFF